MLVCCRQQWVQVASSYTLLEVNLRFVQCPADSLEIGADVEERCSLGVEASEDSLLANGNAEV